MKHWSYGSLPPPAYECSLPQKREQPSPSCRLPSSHSSSLARKPSPQRLWQPVEQPKSGSPLRAPRSQYSPGSRRPLPQTQHGARLTRQSAVQARCPPRSPGASHAPWPPKSLKSHSSRPSLTPLPQMKQPRVSNEMQWLWHPSTPPSGYPWLAQVSPPTSAPSQRSGPSRRPSPQNWQPERSNVQFGLQASRPPSASKFWQPYAPRSVPSHCSMPSRNPLPQRGSRQLLQPSPKTKLPSSHSSFGCWIPSPQNSDRHAWLQPSPSRVLPSSHCSPGSRTP